jgi:predicted nucleotidyltransferase
MKKEIYRLRKVIEELSKKRPTMIDTLSRNGRTMGKY